jgi:hypothetical protein
VNIWAGEVRNLENAGCRVGIFGHIFFAIISLQIDFLTDKIVTPYSENNEKYNFIKKTARSLILPIAVTMKCVYPSSLHADLRFLRHYFDIQYFSHL